MMRLSRFLLLLPLLVVIAACSSSPKAPKPGPLPDLPAERVQLDRVWKAQVGNGPEALLQLRPSITAQQIVAASHDGVLSALDAETGKVQWRIKTKLPFTAGPAAGYGVVVVGTGKGELLAYNATNGELRWKVQLGAGVHAAPVVMADRVAVLTSDGVVHMLNSATGEQHWTYSTPVPPLSLRGSAGPVAVGSHLLVPTAAGKVLSLDAESGVVEWDTRVATNTGRSELERMVDIQGELLLDGDSSLYSVGFQSQLAALSVQDGRRRWQFDVSSVHSLAAGLGNVYVVDTGSTVIALDHESGKPVWKQPDLAWRGIINPVVLGPVLVTGDAKGYAHILSQSDGTALGRERLVRSGLVSLSVQGDLLYTWSANGVLGAWKIRSR
ncbi:MAG: outer membrane protein assembly factor BamB [Moraxellaceae bacterium]|nr:outer membrane protein assembly factor BamB [Moraxellaceae bacterium]MBP7229098.1 outer membrane protein assembly factor BamB [Moraxellaceae bacterium]MBP8851398.1 outer membrane protein assembly factor BamB [Moraxellaceae bacterium]MBP9044957.1 outer membrane protein assembly factor BamB [Moraxellaceae bacterium]MBP9730108.1 outer membrane protein assembly factor BamB [Moraxellaceae bacterium]